MTLPVDFPGGRKSCTLLLDTGAPVSCFDTSHRPALGAATGQLTIQHQRAETFAAPRIWIGGLAVHARNDIVALDLRVGSAGLGLAVDGVLGADSLHGLVFSIDFDTGRLRFIRSAPEQAGVRVPLLWTHGHRRGHPVVRVDFGGGLPQSAAADPATDGSSAGTARDAARRTVLFIVDTGYVSSRSGALAPADCAALVDLGFARALPVGPLPMHGLEGPEEVTLFQLRGLSLAGVRHRGAVFARHPPNVYPTNMLGLAFLSRYFVVFDFANDCMYLRPREPFPESDAIVNAAEAEVERRGRATFVTHVGAGGRAEAAGLMKGDQIVTVDSRPARDLSLFGVRRAFRVEGPHVLGIRRNGRNQRVILDLEPAAPSLPPGQQNGIAPSELEEGGRNVRKQIERSPMLIPPSTTRMAPAIVWK